MIPRGEQLLSPEINMGATRPATVASLTRSSQDLVGDGDATGGRDVTGEGEDKG